MSVAAAESNESMRCRKIDKLLVSTDYVGNKWLQLCADTARGPGFGGGGGDGGVRQTVVQCATQRSL